MRIATNGIVFNEFGDVLLIQRNDTRTLAPPGGHLERGELPTDNVAREVREETGLIVMPIRLVGVNYWHVKPDGVLTFVFRCLQRGGELATSVESPRVGFFSSSPLPWPMLSFHRERIEQAMRHRGGPAILTVQEITWPLSIAWFVLTKVIYRYLDLKRILRKQPTFQPPPNWRIKVFLVMRNERGEVLWVQNDSGVSWRLPGGPSREQETPWLSAVRIAMEEIALEVEITRLSGVYNVPGDDLLILTFTAETRSSGNDGSQRRNVRFFPPEDAPANAPAAQLQYVTDACGTSLETIFNQQDADAFVR